MKKNRSVSSDIDIRVAVNKLIYYCQKAPIIKRFIPPYIMGDEATKKNLKWVVMIYRLLRKVVGSALYLLVMVFLSHLVVESLTSLNLYPELKSWQIFVFLIFMLRLVRYVGAHIIDEDRPEKWLLILNFKMTYRDYFFYRFWKKLRGDVLFMVAAWIAMISLDTTIVQRTLAFLIVLALFPICELLNIYMFKRVVDKKNPLRFQGGILIVGWIFGLLMTFIGIRYFDVSVIIRFLLSPFVFLVFMVGAGLSIHRINHYSAFEVIGVKQFRNMRISNSKASANIELMFEQARIDKDVDLSDSISNPERFSGLGLLNHVFLRRHRRLWQKPLKRRLIALGVFALIIVGYALFVNLTGHVLIPRHNLNTIFDRSSMFLFIVYFLALGDSICSAYFKNCDRSLLHYAFYRRKEIIWKQFVNRFLTILRINLIVYVVLILDLLLLRVLLTDIPLATWLSLSVTLFGMFCFLSVHFLFLYYIIQPYNQHMQVKSPLYLGVTFVFGFLIYQGRLIDKIPHANIVITLFSFVYFIVAIILVYKFSEKTFKIRR